jgi:hypothetical protein
VRARWVLNDTSPEEPHVGWAIVASWWPTIYHAVSTIRTDPVSPLRRLTRSLTTGEYTSDALPEEFVTQVFRCSRDGFIGSFDHPLYERAYSEIDQARLGHKEVVDLLRQGRLKLSRCR